MDDKTRHTASYLLRAGLFSGLAFLLICSAGCTDRRSVPRGFFQADNFAPSNLVPVSDVRFQNQNIEVMQMQARNGSLYLTGTIFGFSKWDIHSDPENPVLTFAASDNIAAITAQPVATDANGNPISSASNPNAPYGAGQSSGPSSFDPQGRWRPDWYASGGLDVVEPFAYMSGVVGSSVVDMSDTNFPIEANRYPAINVNTTDPNSDNTPSDPRFQYKAVVANPQIPVLYGFRQQDYVVSWSIQGPNLVGPISTDAYSANGSCCVMGATAFSSHIFVAFRNALWMFGWGADGKLTAPTILPNLQAVNVQSTGQFLYVQHQPLSSAAPGSAMPAGIYVFDQSGNQVSYFPINPYRFTVSADDSHLYANVDNTAVRVYRLGWNGTGGTAVPMPNVYPPMLGTPSY